jgi:hypothetical protein
VHFQTPYQSTEILSILRDQNPVFFDTPRENCVVRLAASSHIERMNRVETPFVESPSERRG